LALLPGQEGHGGSTFCGVAALVLMNRLDVILDNAEWKQQLLEWCVKRQLGGMQGRPNKVEDTCYSYWIGGTLRLLGYDHLLQREALQQFVASCQSPMGGFSKVRDTFPDLLHSFYSLAYWSLSTNPNTHAKAIEDDEAQTTPLEPPNNDFRLKPLNCTLGICQERAELFGPTFFP
jgi:geranylgeranyl transferase type-1 subunit beta